MSESDVCTVRGCSIPSDGYFVCQSCATDMVNALIEMHDWMLDDLQSVVTRQTRYVLSGGGAHGKANEMPLMFDARASEVSDEITNEIGTSARLLAESNNWPEEYNNIREAAMWLEKRPIAIRLHEGGGQIAGGVIWCKDRIEAVLDRPAPRQFLGDCTHAVEGHPCPGAIYGRPANPFARCDTCGETYDAAGLRKKLLAELDDRLASAGEIARLSTYLGLTDDREKVRKRINQWHKRGQVTEHKVDGQTAFRFGEVYDKLILEESKRHVDKVS